MLRWLVAHAIRNTSQEAVRDAAQDAVRNAQDTSRQVLPMDLDTFPPVDIVVFFALSIESSPFIHQLETPRRFRWEKTKGIVAKFGERYVAVVNTGVGTDAAGKLVERVAPALPANTKFLSAGFSGALVAELKRSDLLMANTVTDGKRSIELPCHIGQATIDATPYLHTGKLLTVDHIVSSKEERAALAEQHGAVACDMESAEVADRLERFGRSLTSVRIISDGVDDEIPLEVSKLLAQNSLASKVGAATGALFQRPSVVKDLWKLRDQSGRTANRLAGFLVGVVEQV